MSDEFIGQVLADKYRIDSVVREGALGRIYHGTHLLMDKPVTIKILAPDLAADEETVAKFSAEAHSLSHVAHPHILNVTDFGTDRDGTVYIIFEDAEGETLASVIRRERMFPADRAVHFVKQIASGLSAAHQKGIVHGNLNSENVFLIDADNVKIVDLATVKPDADAFSADTHALSSFAYFAPEQFTDPTSADERADIYALGVILYEMLAGEVPFRSTSVGDLMVKHQQEPPPPLSAYRHDLPADVELIILRALAKNPDMRYQTADEFVHDLDRISLNIREGEGVVAARPPAADDNNIWKTAFVVLAGISILAIGLIYATSVKQTDPATALQTDANGQPVQPLNPATGLSEQGLANIAPLQSGLSNSNGMVAPETLTGSDANPYWQSGTVPPGAPPYIPQGGEVITIGNSSSPFMQDGVILVPVQTVNANVNVKPSPTPRATRTPANANTPPTPETDDTPQPQATPEAKPNPARTPTPTPRSTERPKTNQSADSAKPDDTN